MEVGLGGRLDATNVAMPELSIITSISLDHEQHLGESRASVAREKSGILRSGRPAIAWPSRPRGAPRGPGSRVCRACGLPG